MEIVLRSGHLLALEATDLGDIYSVLKALWLVRLATTKDLLSVSSVCQSSKHIWKKKCKLLGFSEEKKA